MQPTNGELAQLRQLLLNPEQAELTAIRARLTELEMNANKVGDLLPDAVRLRVAKDDQLAESLAPTIGKSVRSLIRDDPQSLVDAISPIMGPAIRNSIVLTIRNMMQSLNRTLEYSTSVNGLRWRLEAWRTGKPFAEIVMLKTMLFRVEQVLLIHRRTGLLLEHLMVDAGASTEADVISAMLTAIQDFVKDSFHVPAEESMQTLQVGELTVWVEQGPQALLAGVIHGAAPESLRLTFRESLERIHMEYGDALTKFSGDATLFGGCRPHLESCLQSREREDAPKSSGSKGTWLVGAVAALLLVWFGWWAVMTVRRNTAWNEFVAKARQEPGVVVTFAEKRGGKYVIHGLRDPLAHHPFLHFDDSRIPHSLVESQWTPYFSFEDSIVEKRVQRMLNVPLTVEVQSKAGVVTFTGTATAEWLDQVRRTAPFVPGVQAIDTAGVATR